MSNYIIITLLLAIPSPRPLPSGSRAGLAGRHVTATFFRYLFSYPLSGIGEGYEENLFLQSGPAEAEVNDA